MTWDENNEIPNGGTRHLTTQQKQPSASKIATFGPPAYARRNLQASGAFRHFMASTDFLYIASRLSVGQEGM